MCSLDVTACTEEPLYREEAALSEVIVYKRKNLLRKTCSLRLYGDRIAIDEGAADALILPFAEVSAAAVLGRNKLNVYCRRQLFQLKGGKRFNALKYVHIFHRHRNIIRGEENGKFLGI